MLLLYINSMKQEVKLVGEILCLGWMLALPAGARFPETGQCWGVLLDYEDDTLPQIFERCTWRLPLLVAIHGSSCQHISVSCTPKKWIRELLHLPSITEA